VSGFKSRTTVVAFTVEGSYVQWMPFVLIAHS